MLLAEREPTVVIWSPRMLGLEGKPLGEGGLGRKGVCGSV